MAVPTRALKADLGDFGDNTLPWDAQIEDVEQEDASLLPVEQPAPSARPVARQEANPFDAFEADDTPIEATRAPSVSVFDQFDDDEPAPDAPERPTPFVNEAFRVLWEDKLGHQASKKDAADESLGRSFLEGIVDPQQYGEFGKGIAPGAIRFGGTAAKGAASIQHSSALASREDYIKQLNLLESVDRGEEVPADAGFDIEIMAYQRMTPEQRADYKKNLQAQAAEDITPLEDRTLFETGDALTKYAKELFPAAKEYDQAVGRQLGEGIGSLLAGLPAGFLGRIPALAFFGTAGSGEAVERALAYDKADRKAGGKGLTEQQIITAALWGIGPGATDLLPVEILLGRLKIPQPFRGPIARSIGRIGGQAFVEGLQEGGQEFLQNLISQQIYNDKQELGQGVLPGAGIGAGVGGIAEVGRQLIARFGGRRSGGQQQEMTPEEEIRAVAEAIDQGQQVNRAAKGDQLDVTQQPAEAAAPAEPSQAVEDSLAEPIIEEAPVVVPEPAPDAPEAAVDPEATAEPAVQPLAPEELQAAEQDFILPEIGAMDEEIGAATFSDAYAKLSNDEKAELIERSSRQDEDVADLLEEFAIRNEDVAGVAAMAVRRGLTDEQITQVRQLIQQNAPDLATGFDELVALLPKRGGARAASGGRARSTAQFTGDQLARISELQNQITSVATQQELGKAIDTLTKSVSASDWKALGQTLTGRNYPSGKAARDAIMQQVSDRLLLDERVQQVKRQFEPREQTTRVPRRKEVGSTLADFAQASSASEIAERFNILLEDAASLLKRNAFTGEAKTIVERLAGKATEGNEHIQNNDWEALGQVVSDMAGDAAALTGLDARPEARLITQWVDTASRLAREGRIPVAEAAPQRSASELRSTFANVLNSRVPRTQWAEQLGMTDAEMQPLIEEAIEKGFLRRDRNGVIRRVPKSQRPGSFAGMVIPNDIPDTLPGEGSVAFTPEAADQKTEMTRAVNRAAMKILPEAVSIDVVDNITIAKLRKEDELLALREDAAFRNWFGDSKVVDEQGNPKVVYHGTQADFDTFDFGKAVRSSFGVSYFTDDPILADDFTNVFSRGEGGGNVVPVYLSFQNPLVIDFGSLEIPSNISKVRQSLLDAVEGGFDSVILENAVDTVEGRPSTTYLAFEPTQIKSIFNRGTFDPTDPRISYALRKGPFDFDNPGGGSRVAKVGDTEITYGVGKDGLVELILIKTPKAKRGQGSARQAMQQFLRDADARGLRVGLSADPMDAGISKAKLVDFYKSLGFKRNAGRDRDFSTRLEFIREPQVDQMLALRTGRGQTDAVQIESRLQEITNEVIRLQRLAIPKAEDKANLEALRQERKQLIAQWEELPLEARAAKDQMLALRAFHGSPHDFDRFSLDRIGTGEGAQAFGHGLYFAENELVAKSYRDVLTQDMYIMNGEPLDSTGLTNLAARKLDGSLDEYKAEIKANIEGLKKVDVTDEYAARLRETKESVVRANENALSKWESTLKDIERVENADIRRSGGLYEVEIDVEPEQLLDWDKPLSEQSENVRKAIIANMQPPESFNGPLRRRAEQALNGDFSDIDGASAIKLLGGYNEPAKASQILREAGIPGIRYLDQGSRGSRGSGDGTRNIVIFDDTLVKITKKNGKPVGTAERQQVVDQMLALRAFHSSPYDFDRFDTSKINTGEGAQVFGWGLYFADSEKVAGHYALSVPDQQLLREAREAYDEFEDPDSALELLLESPTVTEPQKRFLSALAKDDWFGFDYPHQAVRAALRDDPKNWDASQETLDAIEGLSIAYEVNINADEKDFLDWDKPVTEQPIAEKIGDIWFRGNSKAERADLVKQVFSGWTGRDLYKQVSKGFGSDEAASKYLAKNGVAGVRYLDQASRRRGEGTRNTVVFDDSIIEITHKDGKPVTGEERQGVVDQMLALHSGDTGPRTPTEVKVYHGTGAGDIQRFDPAQSVSDGAIFFTPSTEAASRYAGRFGDLAVYPVYIETENFKTVDFEGRAFMDEEGVDAGTNPLDGEIALAKEEGYSGLIVQNIEDIGGTQDQYVTWTEGTVRSSLSGEQMFAMRRQARQPEALGRTDPYNMVISIAMKAVEAEARAKGVSTEQEAIRVLRHEAIEFFNGIGMFTPKEWQLLQRTARKQGWVESTGVRQAYEVVYKDGMTDAEMSDLLVKEAIAEQYSEFHLNRKQFKGKTAELFQRIKDFISRVANFMRGEGFQTWDDVFTRIDEGEFKARFEAKFPELAPQQQPMEQLAEMAAQALPGNMPNPAMAPPPPGPTPGTAPSAPGSLVDIQRRLRKRLGLPVKRGRLSPEMKRLASQMGGMLRGQFSRQTGVIRLAILEDIDSEAHEVGHALESRYDLEPVKARHHNALMGIARMSGRDSVSEGFAEFFRLYVTNPPAAEAHAPDFFNEFEDVMNAQDPQALAAIQDIRDQYQDWRNASSAGRITAAIKSGVKESTFQEIRNEYKEGGIAAVSGMYWRYLERIYQGRIDRTNPIRKLMMRIARQAEKNNQDIDLTTWRNPQMQAQKIVSSDAAAYIDLTQAVHWENSAGKGTVSLRDALLHAYGGTEFNNWSEAQRANFGAYMIARRGRWIWRRYEMDPAQNRGRGPNPPNNPSEGDWYFDTMRRQRRIFLGNRWETELMRAPDKHNRADHVQTVADLEAANPQFAQAAQMVYQFLRDLALKRYQAGLDSREEYEYKTGTPDYVPWFRDMSDEIFAGTAVAGRKVAAKFAIKGSYRDFIDPIEGIARQVYDTNQEIAVNKPKLLLAKMAEEVQNAGQYAEIIPATRMKVEEVRIRDALQSAAIAEGLPPEDAREMISTVASMIGEDAVAKLFKSEQAGEGRDAILHYMDNGVLKMLQIHDDGHGIAKDILGFFEMTRGTPFGDSFFDMLTGAVRVPQRGITAHPGFLWRNAIRDTYNAAVMQAGYFPIVSNIRTVASNFVRKRRGEETWAQILARHGGIMGGLNRTNIQQLRQGRVSGLRTEGVVLNPARRDFWARTVNPLHEDFWKWAEWSEANARQTLARIAFNRAFQDARSRYPTMPVEQQTFIALEASVQHSRDYTDYGRMGDFPSQVVANRLIMFLNPALQGPDKMFRKLFLAQTNEGKFATAQVVRKKLAPIFDDQSRTKPLTKSEKDALKDAMRAWVTVAIIAHVHLLIELLFNDDDELRDKKELERALNVPMTINGQPYRIPRGFDVVNVASNALRAQYDSWRHEDPTAWQRFRKTLGYSLVPPHSSPLLDMYIGWKHGRNNFFGSDIEPEYMQGRLPEDRYKAYTSKLSKDIAEGINTVAPFEVSPLMVEYTMNTVGSDWARDILRAYDAADPDKPALRWQEYPFIRTTRGLRGSRGSEDFWQLMGRDGAFIQPAGSYKEEAVKGKVWTQEDLRKFFERRVTDDDARAYAILNGHYDTDQRRLHPMERAKEFIRALSATGRQVGFNRIDDPKTGERYEVSRAVRQQANEIMAEISRREYLNALIAVQRPGYEFREPMPVKPYLEELERVSPDIHNALMDKIKIQRGTKVYDYETVRQNWPEIRRQLLDKNKREDIIESRAQVEYRDLNRWVGEARALGIR